MIVFRKIIPYAAIVPVFTVMSVLAQEPIVIGNTYPIAEPDVLEEMKSRAKDVNWQQHFSQKAPTAWSGYQSDVLPTVQTERTRLHRPIYVLDHTIADQQGQVMYPKGYSFNPLAYMTLPNRLIVIGDSEDYIPWLKKFAQPSDMIITAGGNPVQLSQVYGQPVFLLEPTLRERLDIQFVPSIVQQEGDALRIEEMAFHPNVEEKSDAG